MTEVRKNEFKDLLEMNELMFVEHTDFIKADIPELGAVTYYPKKNRLIIHKKNKWYDDGFYFVKNHLGKSKEKIVVKCSLGDIPKLNTVAFPPKPEIKVKERVIVRQEWYETDTTKTGWDSHGWYRENEVIDSSWTVVAHLGADKYGNPTLGVAEREVEI